MFLRKTNGTNGRPPIRPSTTLNGSATHKNSGRGNGIEGGVEVKPIQIASSVLDYYYAVSLVLGGCCANVLAYEKLLKSSPSIGSALTFSQMLFIALQTLPSFLHFPSKSSLLPRLKPRQVPLHQWALQVLVHTSSLLLGNWVFAYDVPLTLQIVFRSAGLAVSMLFGFVLLGRRYSLLQVSSVIFVSIGVILATLSRAPSPTRKLMKARSPDAVQKYFIGIAMLVASLVTSAILGILQERTYKKYGPCWREGVFYTHALALPIFAFLSKDVSQGIKSLSTTSSPAYLSYLVLVSNLVSQLVCVSGVNKLSSQVSSVSTNLVLTTRKAVSLCLSVWWFGNGWNAQLAIGAAMVFLGSVGFSMNNQHAKDDSTRRRTERTVGNGKDKTS